MRLHSSLRLPRNNGLILDVLRGLYHFVEIWGEMGWL